MSEEREIWRGGPSQWQNLGWFISCILLLPIPFALWKWLETRSHRYVLTDQRLQLSRDIFNRVTDDLELYRVRDTRLEQPFWQRMLGLGEVVLFTTDASTPEIHLPWLPDATQVREDLRRLVEARREAKHVRTLETGIE